MSEETIQDGYNVAHLTELGIKLEAIEDKIIVLIDQYKSGYECSTCQGKGEITEVSRVVEGATKITECPECHGKKVIIHIPEISKSLPTSGVVISLGENCKALQYEDKYVYDFDNRMDIKTSLPKFPNAKIRLGARVVFGPHVGSFIPFKGNIRLKIMREHEPLCIMYGVDAGAKDFMEFDQEF